MESTPKPSACPNPLIPSPCETPEIIRPLPQFSPTPASRKPYVQVCPRIALFFSWSSCKLNRRYKTTAEAEAEAEAEAKAEAEAQAEVEAEAEAEANAKGSGRGKGSRDFLNTF